MERLAAAVSSNEKNPLEFYPFGCFSFFLQTGKNIQLFCLLVELIFVLLFLFTVKLSFLFLFMSNQFLEGKKIHRQKSMSRMGGGKCMDVEEFRLKSTFF